MRGVNLFIATFAGIATLTLGALDADCVWEGPRLTSQIKGNNIASYSFQSIGSCKSKCENTPNCKSFEISGLGKCYLNDKDSSDVDVEFGLYTYYEIKCGNSLPDGCKWVKTSMREIDEHNIVILHFKNEASCKQACENEPACRSIDLTTLGICALNNVNTKTTPSRLALLTTLYEIICENEPIGCAWLGPNDNTKITLNNLKILGFQSHSSCMAACDAQPGCLSVEIDLLGICTLNDKNSQDSPLAFSLGTTYYEKQCAAKPDTCSWKAVVQDKFLEDFDLGVRDDITRDECKEACEKSPHCRAVDYNIRNGNCYLNGKIAAETPQGLESHEDMEYHELDCDGLQCTEGMAFKCATCNPTCADPNASRCPGDCVDGCYCEDGKVFDGSKCISEDTCCTVPARDEKIVQGESYETNDCTQACTCVAGGKVECEDINKVLVDGKCEDPAIACNLPKDAGTGSGSANRYFFNKDKCKCLSFIFKGEGGNANNFPSKQVCETVCDAFESPEQCLNPVDAGNCDGREQKFYYNKNSNTCKKFNYTGCGGNTNRFDSKAVCAARCKKC